MANQTKNVKDFGHGSMNLLLELLP
ncbi:hypothetical protein CCACVL1_00768 [Corchorus capsularis]|uniref:Uncharacterized protein n=1 Tax=Corchorus capsularis TaxID=210143 RepID=A0A1R3KUW9_COCAP|nr:hypothetical protein CCACVL1_00768 [Corchorus capsularis]